MSVQSRHAGRYILLHDDAEEDLVGTDWHQQAINSLYNSLRDLALRNTWPWHVGNQLTLVAWKPDRTAWRPSPDIMVHPHAGSHLRTEMSAYIDGLPALVIEVASETTWDYDVDIVEGKAAGYMALPVQDYLVFDPTGRFLDTPCRGWQRAGNTIEEWRPSADGRYISSSLGIAFHPDDDLLRVFDTAGQPVLYEYEKTREIATQAHEIATQAQELAVLRAELATLRGQDTLTDSTAGSDDPARA